MNYDSKKEILSKLRYDFIKKTDRKNLYNEIKHLVETAKEVYNEDLEKRRKKLKDQLCCEEVKLNDELLLYYQQKSEKSKLEIQETLKSYKIQKENEIKNFVKTKKLQVFINNDDEIRSELRKNLEKETRMAQLLQIEENCKIKKRECDEEILWLKVRQRVKEEEDRRQKLEEDIKRMVMKQTEKELNTQKQEYEEKKRQDKIFMMQERLANEEKWKKEEQKLENERILLEAKQKMQSNDLKAQREQATRIKQERERQEKEFDKQFHESLMLQIKREDDLLKSKVSDFKISMLKYLEYCNELKKELENERKESDKAFNSFKKKIECKELQKIQAIKEKKAEEARKTHEDLLKQISDNQQKRLKKCEEEFEKAVNERETHLRKMDEEDNALKMKKIEMTMKYKQELLKQIEETKILNDKMKKENDEDIRRAAEEDDYRRKLAAKLIEDKTIIGMDKNPNWLLICCPCNSEK